MIFNGLKDLDLDLENGEKNGGLSGWIDGSSGEKSGGLSAEKSGGLSGLIDGSSDEKNGGLSGWIDGSSGEKNGGLNGEKSDGLYREKNDEKNDGGLSVGREDLGIRIHLILNLQSLEQLL
ncbi:hypothetical protein HPT25_20050 [Bacillus sp. BRMEA1]|nr:hypothetical protein [Neobacillus endophyticus]NRD79658.1 hypothetical protein [Neobacillus endophyticus]